MPTLREQYPDKGALQGRLGRQVVAEHYREYRTVSGHGGAQSAQRRSDIGDKANCRPQVISMNTRVPVNWSSVVMVIWWQSNGPVPAGGAVGCARASAGQRSRR